MSHSLWKDTYNPASESALQSLGSMRREGCHCHHPCKTNVHQSTTKCGPVPYTTSCLWGPARLFDPSDGSPKASYDTSTTSHRDFTQMQYHKNGQCSSGVSLRTRRALGYSLMSLRCRSWRDVRPYNLRHKWIQSTYCQGWLVHMSSWIVNHLSCGHPIAVQSLNSWIIQGWTCHQGQR